MHKLISQKKQAIKKAEEDAKAKAFLDAITSNPAVKTTASGLKYEILKDTTGAKPLATDKVTVHYKGTLVSGKVFDSSRRWRAGYLSFKPGN